MKKGKLMSEAAVQALSFHRSDEGPVFFTGIVAAGMKKNTSYNAKLTLDPKYSGLRLQFVSFYRLNVFHGNTRSAFIFNECLLWVA